MTEHEKLKWICDKIGYEIDYEFLDLEFVFDYDRYSQSPPQKINVREIIFTQEFMDKYINKLSYTKPKLFNYEGLIENLDNLVDYLYNLIKPWNVQN